MKTFEQYEAIAIDCRKALFNQYTKEQNLELEYNSKGGINGGTEIYEWRKAEKNKLDLEFKGNNLKSLFLESWSKGDFYSCDAYFSRFV